MKRFYTSIFCLAFFAVIIAPTSTDAQQGTQNVGPRPHFSDSRAFNENPGMGWNKGKTLREIMDELQNTPMVKADLTTIRRTRTYDLTTLDNRLTGEAIAWEQIKQSIVDGVIDWITEDAKAAKNLTKKVYGKQAGVSYELLPDRDVIKTLLPSLIFVEETDEDWGKEALRLKAQTRISLSRIVPMILAIQDRPSARGEITGVRSIATDAMHEILQMQEATAPGKGSALNKPYSDAANRLIAADHLERGRYFALRGQTQEALDAYTKAIETSPGLSVAYRNRGGVHLYLKDHAKAVADFLNAYTNDAIDHTEGRDFEACIGAAEAALRLFEDYGAAYYHRAVCRVGLRQQDTAMADFKRAAQLGEKRAQGILTSKSIAW